MQRKQSEEREKQTFMLTCDRTSPVLLYATGFSPSLIIVSRLLPNIAHSSLVSWTVPSAISLPHLLLLSPFFLATTHE